MKDYKGKKNLYPIDKTTPILLKEASIRFTGRGKIWSEVVKDSCDVEILSNGQFHTFTRFKDEKKFAGERVLDLDIYIHPDEHKKILDLLEKNINTTIESEKDPSLGQVNFKIAYVQARFMNNKWAYESEQNPQNAICWFRIWEMGILEFYIKYAGTDKWNKASEIIEIRFKTSEYGKIMHILRSVRSELTDKAENMRSDDMSLYKQKQSDLFEF